MKKRLLNFIVCPLCQKSLELRIFQEEKEEIKEGLLLCPCGQFFPIINYIPRILISSLRSIVYENFPEFFKNYRNLLPQEQLEKEMKKEDLKKKKTSESFGYEWQKFSKMIKEWEKNFHWYFEPLRDINFLKDRFILEAGCGKGRHTYYVAKLAKELITFDLSVSIDVAFSNNKNSNNIHFIQADIYNLPFRENLFDFIFSLGVLHHLPRPEEGFRRLIKLLKNNGSILVYLYHRFSYKSFNYYLLMLVNSFRYLTTRIPHGLLYWLCYPIAIFSYLILVLPYKIISKVLKIKKITKINWPLKAYSDYRFQVLLNDTFDRFSAPIENRYSKKEILAWYRGANLKNIIILGEDGWRAFGTKNNF